MQAVVDDTDWHLRAVHDGAIVKTIRARDLMRQISQATWECADPGMQFDTTINHWHTACNTGRINGSNPCSEYMHIDNSACNLASINLLRYLGEDGVFDIEAYKHTIEIMFTAQEILVGNADYPTVPIGDNSRKFRQLGLGYANLGALLMALGLPYDSDEGRALAGAITSLMTGHAYATSARTASRMGPFAGYAENSEHMLRVLGQHRAAAATIDEELVPPALLSAAQQSWDTACELAAEVGVRNSQASVLAPTGTIGLMMDCDTTGVEPDLGLVKMKKLVGGGTMSIVNQTIPRALTKLGYTDAQMDEIVAYINENMSILGAPHIKAEHIPVFACSMGDNMPEDVSVEEVEKIHIEAWQLGIKAVAIYRDNCKVAQPLSASKKDDDEIDPVAGATEVIERVVEKIVYQPIRQKLPRTRVSRTFEFRVADCKGFVTVGEYEDGRPGEIFVRVSKQGSTLAGIMDAFAISVSHGLQYGVPLRSFIEAFTGMRFEPAGMTDDPDIRIANSLMDYLFRRMAIEYLSPEERAELNILTTSERMQPTLPGVDEGIETRQGSEMPVDPPSIESVTTLLTETQTTMVREVKTTNHDAPMCMQCGVTMQRAGSCHACPSCGTTSGCS
jgi:ribonucleoside-diphosphate reductase alpha chain